MTDGLVVHLDGIRNTSLQPIHDNAASTWVDLATPGSYASFVTGGAKCGWTAKIWNPGKEFTYTEGAKVRVTWGPMPKGMTLVIR